MRLSRCKRRKARANPFEKRGALLFETVACSAETHSLYGSFNRDIKPECSIRARKRTPFEQRFNFSRRDSPSPRLVCQCRICVPFANNNTASLQYGQYLSTNVFAAIHKKKKQLTHWMRKITFKNTLPYPRSAVPPARFSCPENVSLPMVFFLEESGEVRRLCCFSATVNTF